MTILFPNSPLHTRRADPDFEAQFQAAREAGLVTLLLDFDALIRGEADRALRLVPPPEEGSCILVYRGWMLSPEAYAALHSALWERGWLLLNGPEAYALCHLLPNWYPLIEGRTPRSAWLPIPECFDPSRVVEAAASFGPGALVVKDYVKSRKHEWSDACFISNAQDAAEVERVARNFLDRQGESLVGGLVLRKFVALSEAAPSQPGAAPASNEWRLFRLSHRVIACAPHASAAEGDFEAPPLHEFESLAALIPSDFYAMDVAQTNSGQWIVLEVGDGGVSGLPPRLDTRTFYDAFGIDNNGLK